MWSFISWLIGLIFKVKGNPIATGIVQAVGGIMATFTAALAKATILEKLPDDFYSVSEMIDKENL